MVSLALPDVPSLSLFSPFAVGFGGGGGGGGDGGGPRPTWTPSDDHHAMGESCCFLLVKVTIDMAEFCLGCIKTDERRFCWSTVCNIVAHKKQCYKLSCQEVFYIPTATHWALRQSLAFQVPCLDASRMTPGIQQVVTDPGELGMKTTHKWEEFILQANLTCISRGGMEESLWDP